MTDASHLKSEVNGKSAEGDNAKTVQGFRLWGLSISGVVVGGLMSVALVAFAGYLALQVEATQAGVVLDWRNNVTSVESPRTPWLIFGMLAVLGWVVLWVSLVGVGRVNKQFQRGAVLAFTVTTVGLVVWALMSYPLPGDAEYGLLALRPSPFMWLEKGGTLPMVHMFLPVPFAAWLYRRRR